MSFKDILGSLGTKGGTVGSLAIGTLTGVAKDLLLAIAPEIVPAINEYVDERKTPDGWTSHERGHYLIGVLVRIKAKQIGPSYVDRIGDWLIDGEIEKIGKRLDEEDAAGNVVPPVVPPTGFPYDTELTEPPDYSKLSSGNAVYKFKDRAAWVVFRVRVTVGVPNLVLIDIIP